MLAVEDGTGANPDVDSYVSVADADAYMLSMGHAAWADKTEADKEVALRRGTQYVDTRFNYKGQKLHVDQPLDWPRTGFVWPVKRVIQATCEAALRSLDQELYVDVAPDELVTQETIGPLTTKFANPVSDDPGQTYFAIVDNLLAPLEASANGGGGFRVERA